MMEDIDITMSFLLISNNKNAINIYRDQGMLTAWNPLTLSCHTSLSAITLGKPSRWHPVSAQN